MCSCNQDADMYLQCEIEQTAPTQLHQIYNPKHDKVLPSPLLDCTYVVTYISILVQTSNLIDFINIWSKDRNQWNTVVQQNILTTYSLVYLSWICAIFDVNNGNTLPRKQNQSLVLSTRKWKWQQVAQHV